MKISTKLTITALLPTIAIVIIAGTAVFMIARNAILGHTDQWLSIRLAEGTAIIKKHEDILQRYSLQNIPASVAKAKLDALSELSGLTISDNGYIFVVDHQGVIVSHPDKYFMGTDAGSQEWFRQLKEFSEMKSIVIHGEPCFARHFEFIPWNWHILAVDPQPSVFETLEKIKALLIFVCVSAVFLIGFIMVLFSRIIILKPIRALSIFLKQVEKGNYDDPLKPFSNDEISNLNSAISQAAQKVNQRWIAEKQRHSYYSALFDQTVDLVTITDKKGIFLFVSPSSERLTGYPPNELLGLNVEQFIHPSHTRRLQEHFRLGMLSDVIAPPTEFKFRHKNELWITMELVSKNMLDHPDIKGFVTTSRNISRHKSIQKTLENKCRDLEQEARRHAARIRQMEEKLFDEQKKKKEDRLRYEKESDAISRYLHNLAAGIRNDLCAVTMPAKLLSTIIHEKDLCEHLSAIAQAGDNIFFATCDLAAGAGLMNPKPLNHTQPFNIHAALEEFYQRYKARIIEKPVLFTRALEKYLPDCLYLYSTGFKYTLFCAMEFAVEQTRKGRIKLSSQLDAYRDNNTRIDFRIRIEFSCENEMPTLNLQNETFETVPENNRFSSAVDQPLFLCRHLAQLMGAQLAVKQKPDNSVNIDILYTNIKICCSSDIGSTLPEIDISATAFKDQTCLIADTSESSLAVLANLFSGFQMTVFKCETAEQALKIAQNRKPDLIFLDMKLLHLNEADTLSLLKQNSITKGIPVVLTVSSENTAEFSSISPDQYQEILYKPFDLKKTCYVTSKYLLPSATNLVEGKTGPAADDTFQKILSCCRKNETLIQAVIKSIRPYIPDTAQGIQISDIPDFSARLISLGKKYNVKEMEDLGGLLFRCADLFDIEQLDTLLTGLHDILDQIKSTSGGPD